MNEKFLFMPKRKVVVGVVLIASLLFALGLMPPGLAESEPFQNITVDTAYYMIQRDHSFPDLVILDVRNQTEYAVNHLYGAILIPLYELETRIGEIEEHTNHEIVVYCGSGGRSEIASGILADNGFTKVYNMLGGITAWVEAGYPLYTTYHQVSVDITGNKGVHVEIEPLLLEMGCTSCGENQGCPTDSNITNVETTILEQNETCTVILITYELDGEPFEVTMTKTTLWDYSENTYIANKTASFTMTEMSNGSTSVQFYGLNYIVEHMDYDLVIFTNLTPLNAETYNNSITIATYTPVEDWEINSAELVEFNSQVTLSQLYTSLEKVAKKIGQFYKKSHDPTLVQLGQNYNTMADNIGDLSWLVKHQLQEYDKEIIESGAALLDGNEACSIACGASCSVICAVSCTPFLSIACVFICPSLCLVLCSAICGSAPDPCQYGCSITCASAALACGAFAWLCGVFCELLCWAVVASICP